MAAPNIERFNELTGLILAHLYERFPSPVDLYPSMFGIQAPEPRPKGPAGMMMVPEQTADEVFFVSTATWLAEAGYISSPRTGYGYSLPDARLTAKGLEVLNAFPAPLTVGPTLGEKMLDASKSGAKVVLSGAVTEALGLGARLLLNQFGLKE